MAELPQETIDNLIKKGYEQGQTDLLMPYDVESIEELAYKVRTKARADVIEEFCKHIDKHSHISADGSAVCLDDDITILAEQIKRQEIGIDYRLSKANLISAIRFGESLVNPNDSEFDRGFHNGLEWMLNYITGDAPDYVGEEQTNEQ